MFCFSQVFYSVFSSVLLALSIPNELFLMGSPVTGLFALVPLYIAVSRSKSFKQSFLICALHGGLTHLLSSFWLANFQGMAAFTLGASLLGTAAIEGFAGWVIYYPFYKKNTGAAHTALKIFWFAAAWVFYEWCKSTGFLAYPWGTLSMTAVSWTFIIQIADLTTQYGVSFLFALFSALTAEGILLLKTQTKTVNFERKGWYYLNTAEFTAALFSLTLVYGIYQYSKPRTVVKRLNTVLVQQNLDTYRANEMTAIETSQRLTNEGIKEFHEQELKPDLIVWSEGVLNKYFPAAKIYYERKPDSKPLVKYIKQKKVPFIIGGSLAINEDKHKYGNAALLFDTNGIFKGAYVKLHLVPFAEAIPFVDYEPVRKFIKKIAGFSYGWAAGNKYTVFEIPISGTEKDLNGTQIITLDTNKKPEKPVVLVSAPICFDDAYNHVFKGLYKAGCEIFMNITNDSWSKTASAEYQHYAVACYRSIEFRTTMARCTNSGYTVVLNPAGKIIDSLPLFEEASLACAIPVYQRTVTVASVCGGWLAGLFIILIVLYILSDFYTFRKNVSEDKKLRKWTSI